MIRLLVLLLSLVHVQSCMSFTEKKTVIAQISAKVMPAGKVMQFIY